MVSFMYSFRKSLKDGVLLAFLISVVFFLMAFDDEALKLVNSIWEYKLTVKKCIDMRKVKVRQAMWIRRRLVVAVIMVINVTVPSTGGATVRFGFNIGWNVKMSQRPSQPLAKVSRPLN